jgi:outer membrane autotransporter protein
MTKFASIFPGRALAAAAALLLGALCAGSQAQNLIKNGGFETGDFRNWMVYTAPGFGSDFGVGNLNGVNSVPLFQTAFFNGLPTFVVPSSGNYAAFFGATQHQFDFIAQSFHTLSGPSVRGVYHISFNLAYLTTFATDQPGPGLFQVFWNNRVAYSAPTFADFAYRHVGVNETATSPTTTLAIGALGFPPFYFLDNVSVELAGVQFDLQRLTSNQRAVAVSLENAGTDPRLRSVLGYLGSNQVPAFLDRLSPEELTSIFTMSTSYATVQALNIQRRTDDIRSGATGFSAANLAINGFNPSYSGVFDTGTGAAGPSGNDGKEVKETKEVAPAENRWGAFLSGTGEWVNVSGTDNAHGYDLASGGFTLGVDYKVCPNFAIGLAAGYTGTTADLVDHGRVWMNGGKLGIYATVYENPTAPAPTMSKDSSKEAPAAVATGGGWYADMAAFGGYNGYDTRRAALGGDARGSTHGGEVDALFGAGYDFKSGGLTFGPTASFNYTYAGINGFTEHNSVAPLDIHGGDAESLRTAFGMKVSYDCKCGNLLIKPELRLAWQHEFGDTAYALDSSFANGMGSTFTANGPRFGRDSALIGAGFAIQFNDRCSTYLYYDGEVGRRNYESTAVTGGIRVTF